MFRSLFHDHLQGPSFILSAFTTFQLPATSFVFGGVCGRMPSICVCSRCTCLCAVWSCKATTPFTEQFLTNFSVLM
jgi:hypothetical protein